MIKDIRMSALYVEESIKESIYVAEIGVFKGGNALRLVNLNIKKLFLIDPFKEYLQYKKIGYAQSNLNEAQKVMRERMKPYMDKVVIIIEDSIEASKRFADLFFDYVYIDGNHNYETVKSDIEAWYPKVKIGRYIAGHDYSTICTAEAVCDFAREKELEVKSWCKPGQLNVQDSLKDWLIQKK